MKEKTIRKINRLGHFSQVVALILKILVILLLLVLAVATVVSFGLPDEALDVTMTSNFDVSTDFGFTGKTISPSDQQALLSGNGDIASSLFEGSDGLQDVLKEQGASIEYKKVSDHFINAVVSDFGPKTFSMNDIRYGLLAALIETALFLIALFVASSLCKALRFCDSPFEKSVIRRLRGFGFALLFWSLAATCSDAFLDYLAKDESSVTLRIRLGLLFMALIVLALTRIFKYGALLQGEVLPAADGDYMEYDDEAYDDYADAEPDFVSEESMPVEAEAALPEAETEYRYEGEDASDIPEDSEPEGNADDYQALQQENE